MQNDNQVINNILTFMDRVAATGRQEVGAYAEAINWLEAKKTPEAPVEPQKEGKK